MSWFETEAIQLRTAEPDDVDALAGYLNHPDVLEDRQFGPRSPFPLSTVDISKQVEEQSETGRILIVESDGEVVGHVSIDWWWDVLQPWFGVVIHPAHRRNRLGWEVAVTVLDYLFNQTAAHVVTADAGEWNTAGARFAEAVGFSVAGRYRKEVRRDGVWQDIVTFDLLRREWEERRGDRR